MRAFVEQARQAWLDHDRERRCGFPEVIYGQGKTPEQIAAAAKAILARSGRLFATRVDLAAGAGLALELGADFDPLSRTLLVLSRPHAIHAGSPVRAYCTYGSRGTR